MKFNPTKCVVLKVTNKTFPNNFRYSVHNQKLKHVASYISIRSKVASYFRLTLDTKLIFNQHMHIAAWITYVKKQMPHQEKYLLLSMICKSGCIQYHIRQNFHGENIREFCSCSLYLKYFPVNLAIWPYQLAKKYTSMLSQRVSHKLASYHFPL